MNLFIKSCLILILLVLSLYFFLTYIHQFNENDKIQIQPYTKYQKPQFPSQQSNPFKHQSTKVLIDKIIISPQDIDIDPDTETIYTGLQNGKIIKILNQDIKTLQVIGQSQGQILGLQLSKDKKNLYFISTQIGIQKLDLNTRKITTVISQINGVKLNTVSINSFVQTSKGDFYFTIQTDKYPTKEYIKDIIRSKAHGKIYYYSPKLNKIQKIAQNLYFSNGIALQEDQQSILVAQTIMYRIQRIWVEGQKKGKTQILIDNLPGMVDNIHLNQKGQLWVPIIGWRSFLSEYLYRTKFIRNVAIYFQIEWIFQKFGDFGHIGGAKINTKTGQIEEWILGFSQHINICSTLVERNGKLFTGSLKSSAILIIDLEQIRKLAKLGNKKSTDL